MSSTHVRAVAPGFEIYQPNQEGGSIYLTEVAWNRLCTSAQELDEAFNTKQETLILLDEDRDIIVHTEKFCGYLFLHIKKWYNERPTETGITVHQEPWKQLKELLIPTKSMTLAFDVMEKMLHAEVSAEMMKNCEGCVNDYPSQTDHDHLVMAEPMAMDALDKVVDRVYTPRFIAQLADAAQEQGIILHHPYQDYMSVMECCRDKLRESIVSCYHSGQPLPKRRKLKD